MMKKTWGCMVSALIAAVTSVAFGLFNTSAKAEPEARVQTQVTPDPSTTSVLKVGETRSQWMARSKDEAIAKMFPHQHDKLEAATVYVRGIPVLTFVDAPEDKQPKLGDRPKPGDAAKVSNPSKNQSTNQSTNQSQTVVRIDQSSELKLPTSQATGNDPVERATAIAALINQFNRDGMDAAAIVPAWEKNSYVIKFGDRATLKFDREVMLPNSTKNPSEDLLQATNLLRRLLGGAAPVTAILNAPKPIANSLVIQAKQILSGIASWYGPGLHGGRTANGEVFNRDSLTAAHRSLPFGTAVRVTNMANGRSVVVRITDRGPFGDGRVIDLSQGAAQVLGMITSGIAPVRLEVLGQANLVPKLN